MTRACKRQILMIRIISLRLGIKIMLTNKTPEIQIVVSLLVLQVVTVKRLKTQQFMKLTAYQQK